MIPPFVFSLGGKVAMGVLGAAAIAGAIYAYNESLRSEGRSEERQVYTEQIQEQTEQVKAVDTKMDDQRLASVERASAEKDKFNAKLIQSNRAYLAENAKLKAALTEQRTHEVPNEPVQPDAIPALCLVPDRLLDRVDELGRMLNHLSNHRLPGDQASAGQPGAEATGPVACDTLVGRIEVLTSRLGNTMIEHGELWDYSIKQYEAYIEWKRLVYETH